MKKNKNEKNIYKIFAKMWVIVRYDEKFTSEYDDEIFININNEIKKYLDFLQFMNIVGRVPVVIDNGWLKDYSDIHVALNRFAFDNHKKDTQRFTPFYLIYPLFEKTILTIGEKFKDKKFKYLCSIVSSLPKLYQNNYNLAIVSLTSILEMLLTHNPDDNKYHIENSINRQFIKKIMFIMYEYDNDIDCKNLNKCLKLTYQARCDIAHGNFINLNKTFKEIYKHYELEKEYFGDFIKPEDTLEYLALDLHKFASIVIEFYLKDEKRLDLIKDI